MSKFFNVSDFVRELLLITLLSLYSRSSLCLPFTSTTNYWLAGCNVADMRIAITDFWKF